MPTKPVSDRQRIITYASACDESALTEAIETLQAIRAGRFPKESKRSARGRKAGAKRGAPEPVQLTISDEPTNGSNDAGATQPRRGRKHSEPEKFTPDPTVMRMIDENKQAATAD
jgi:hypothetical protein